MRCFAMARRPRAIVGRRIESVDVDEGVEMRMRQSRNRLVIRNGFLPETVSRSSSPTSTCTGPSSLHTVNMVFICTIPLWHACQTALVLEKRLSRHREM